MTREEAIEIFKRLKENAPNEMHLETVGSAQELFDMAIQALSQEPTFDVLKQIRAEIEGTLYVDSLIFDELIDFLNGKISADDVIEEFNRVTRQEVLQIIDEYRGNKE